MLLLLRAKSFTLGEGIWTKFVVTTEKSPPLRQLHPFLYNMRAPAPFLFVGAVPRLTVWWLTSNG